MLLERGPVGARRWYRSQALRAIRMTWSPTASHDLPPARLFAMGDLLHELRFALRQLRHRPLYAGIVVFTLALGIGASGAVLSVANPVLFRSLPYPDPDRVVLIWEIDAQRSRVECRVRDLSWTCVRGLRTLEASAAVSGWTPVLTGTSQAERLTRTERVGGLLPGPRRKAGAGPRVQSGRRCARITTVS